MLRSLSLRALQRSPPTARLCRSASTFTLRALDGLVTSIARGSKGSGYSFQDMGMTAHAKTWLSSQSPDLASSSLDSEVPLTEAEKEDLLRPRHMSDSYTAFDLPIHSDVQLGEKYVNSTGGIRMGKILEHLDSLAGATAYRHCLPRIATSSNPALAFHDAAARAGLYLVTASADRLDIFSPLDKGHVRDLRFSGFVSWTGTSSMEVIVKLEGACSRDVDEDGWQTILLGRFAMVCRDTKTLQARKVPKLIVATDEEKALWEYGASHRVRRKQVREMALDKVPPSYQETKKLHNLMLQVSDQHVTVLDGQTVVPMKDTEMQSVQLMFPQDRNLHGKVFGGILMRLAFELAFTNAAVLARRPMRFLSLDEITFKLPVPIGAVLILSSKVVYTTEPTDEPDGEAKVHLQVRAEVEQVDTGIRMVTNTFFFTMSEADGRPIGKKVVPSTYSEAMDYLEGKRRLEIGDQMRELYRGG